tara:strand:+ start:1115 stop:1504 length:390 start_codon:yes stop_codon:yes gene_type:complete
MFIYNYCLKYGDNFFNEKIDLSKKSEYINKFNLINKGNVKEYWINNVMIVDREGNKVFKYYEDISVQYKDNYLVQNVKLEDCISFNFFKTDTECEYELYGNIIDGIIYNLKVYDKFISFSYISENEVLQ